MSGYIDQIYFGCQVIENGLKVLGYIPGVGTFSSIAGRRALGVLQIIGGLFLSIITYGASLQQPSRALTMQLQIKAVKAALLIVHGILNELRVYLEAIPFVSLVTCLPYDLVGKPILPYDLPVERLLR